MSIPFTTAEVAELVTAIRRLEALSSQVAEHGSDSHKKYDRELNFGPGVGWSGADTVVIEPIDELVRQAEESGDVSVQTVHASALGLGDLLDPGQQDVCLKKLSGPLLGIRSLALGSVNENTFHLCYSKSFSTDFKHPPRHKNFSWHKHSFPVCDGCTFYQTHLNDFNLNIRPPMAVRVGISHILSDKNRWRIGDFGSGCEFIFSGVPDAI